jgi:hypothetical protein
MNPQLPAHVIDKALSEDALKARAEFLNVWREDLSDFIPLDVIESCTDRGVRERPPQPAVKYIAFCDAAGGTGTDSFALAIAHRGPPHILDLVRERKPRFVPSQVIAEYAQLLKRYKVTEVQGDKFALGFHADEWKSHGIKFVPCERTTTDNYLSMLPLLLSGRTRLLDNTTLRTQLAALERRAGAGDREVVSRPQLANAHDDLATVACGALVIAAQGRAYNLDAFGDPTRPNAFWNALRWASYFQSSGMPWP